MNDFLENFLDDYFAECDEHLTTVRRGLLALERSVGKPRPDAADIEELFRTFHSIKGIAGMVEDRESEQLAHEMEAYLRAIREGDARLTSHGIEALIEGTRSLENAIAARRNGEQPPDISPTLAGLRTLIDHGSSLPAIALTAYATKEDQKRALQEGFVAHVGKPFAPMTLISTIARALDPAS